MDISEGYLALALLFNGPNKPVSPNKPGNPSNKPNCCNSLYTHKPACNPNSPMNLII